MDKEESFFLTYLDGTPSGNRALLSAWDDLSFEQKIQVVLALSNQDALEVLQYRLDILKLAFESASPLLRFLAAQQLIQALRPILPEDTESTEYKRLLDALRTDDSSLVRSVLYERTGVSDILLPDKDGGMQDSLYHDPEEFFGLEHEYRLGALRMLTAGLLPVTLLLEAAVEKFIPEDRLSEWELFEIVAEFFALNKTGLWDRMSLFERERTTLPRLWNVAPKLPPIASKILIERLPLNEHFLETSSPLKSCNTSLSDVVIHKKKIEESEYQSINFYFSAFSQFQDYHLLWLLRRKDIELPDLRWSILESAASGNPNNFPQRLVCEAVARNLEISDEFLRSTFEGDRPGVQYMAEQLCFAKGLQLHQYLAVKFYIERLPDQRRFCIDALDSLMRERFTQLSNDSPERLDAEIHWWQRFDLSIQIANSKKPREAFPATTSQIKDVEQKTVWQIFREISSNVFAGAELRSVSALADFIGLYDLPDDFLAREKMRKNANQPTRLSLHKTMNSHQLLLKTELKSLEQRLAEMNQKLDNQASDQRVSSLVYILILIAIGGLIYMQL